MSKASRRPRANTGAIDLILGVWLCVIAIITLLALCFRTETVFAQQPTITYAGQVNTIVVGRSPHYPPARGEVPLDHVCPAPGSAQLELQPNGTFVMNLTYVPSISHQMVNKEIQCEKSDEPYSFVYHGSYTRNPNTLVFSTVDLIGFVNPREAANGSGTFTDTSAQGTVTADIFQVVQLDFDLPVVQGSTNASCNPSVRGIKPQKPGDVISPGATYVDAAGNEVGIIQERWYINGQETTSAIWDGKKVKLELNWTCPDHNGYFRTFEIPAYQTPPDSQVPGQPAAPPPALPGNLNPADVVDGLGKAIIAIGGIIGIGGAIGVGGAVINSVIAGAPAAGAPAVTPPHAPQPPDSSPPIIEPPQPPPTSEPPRPSTAEPPSREPGKLDPSLKQGWEKHISDLIDRRNTLQQDIQDTRYILDKTKRLQKKNILKVILKGGLDTFTTVIDAVGGLSTGGAEPIGRAIIKKWANDKAMDWFFQKHNTDQDGSIVVRTDRLIHDLQTHIDQLRDQVKVIKQEIASTQSYIDTYS